VLNTGFWQTVPQDPAAEIWTWEGRSQKVPGPAAEEKGTTNGFLLRPDRPLLVAASTARGATTGFNAQFRVPGKGKPFEVSLLLDLGADGRRKRLAFREPDQVLLLEGDANREDILRPLTLEAKITPGRWFDLGWAADSDSLVFFLDRRPLFALRGGVRPDAAAGLLTNTPANVRGIQLRR